MLYFREPSGYFKSRVNPMFIHSGHRTAQSRAQGCRPQPELRGVRWPRQAYTGRRGGHTQRRGNLWCVVCSVRLTKFPSFSWVFFSLRWIKGCDNEKYLTILNSLNPCLAPTSYLNQLQRNPSWSPIMSSVLSLCSNWWSPFVHAVIGTSLSAQIYQNMPCFSNKLKQLSYPDHYPSVRTGLHNRIHFP